MNDDDPTTTVLPRIDDDRVTAIERKVFARIGADRRARRRRRLGGWTVAGGAAAMVVVAALIAPGLTTSTATGGSGSSAVAPATDSGVTEIAPVPEQPAGAGVSGEASRADGGAGDAREVITTGSARVLVDDVASAAEAIAEDARARGGYVESLSVGAAGGDAGSGVSGSVVQPGPPPGGQGGGYVTVRVPSDQLDAAVAQLRQLGEVTSSTVSRQDVTDQAIDVRARIAAGEASVARLTELMAQAADVADLIAAETALSERQAALEADRQQLAWLEGQVELSTLTVELAPRTASVEADPAGFADGIVAGWNGLVATLNGIVIAIGFLLPWLAVLAVTAGIVWGIVRLVRRARRRRAVDVEGD